MDVSETSGLIAPARLLPLARGSGFFRRPILQDMPSVSQISSPDHWIVLSAEVARDIDKIWVVASLPCSNFILVIAGTVEAVIARNCDGRIEGSAGVEGGYHDA